MSLSNRVENTIISIVTALITIAATVLIITYTAIKPLERQLEHQNALIKELAELEKYQIQNNFEKLKSHKGQIVLDLNNDLTHTIDLTTPADTTAAPAPEKKLNFFQKLFKKKEK